MNDNNFFGDSDLVFSPLGEYKTQEQLLKEFPYEFDGKNDFIQFYQIYNGIFFPDGAEICQSRLPNHDRDDNEDFEIECFYDIGGRLEKMWEATKKMSKEANVFAETHIPIARDAAGNEFWIEIPSGFIKYVLWEYGLPDGEFLVAPSFREFCFAIKSLN